MPWVPGLTCSGISEDLEQTIAIVYEEFLTDYRPLEWSLKATQTPEGVAFTSTDTGGGVVKLTLPASGDLCLDLRGALEEQFEAWEATQAAE